MARAPKYGRYKDIKYEESAKKQGLSVCTKHSQPCTNRSCSDEIILRDLEEKIRSGIFVIIHCPLYHQDNCKELVEIPQIKDHIEKKHSTNIFYSNKLNREIGIHESTVDLLKADTEDFLVYIHEDHIYVGCLGPVGNYNKYNVQISCNLFRNISISYSDQDIVEFDERLHCYNCKRGMCTLKHHSVYTKNYRGCLPIDRNILLEFFQNAPKILISVTLVHDLSRSKSEKQQKLVRNSSVICRSLRCTVCSEYTLGKVYGCGSGHLICQQCRKKIKHCQKCKVQLGDARCLLAETLSNDIQLACQTAGCDFFGKLEELSFHEKHCHPYPHLPEKFKDEKFVGK
nr:uncharacterized protein LOC111508992 isoform X1 [Leptinotarsa decemlineata]